MAVRVPLQDQSAELERRRRMAMRATSNIRLAVWQLEQALEACSEHRSEIAGEVDSACVLAAAADLFDQVRKRLHALGLIDSYWLGVEPQVNLPALDSTNDASTESSLANTSVETT